MFPNGSGYEEMHIYLDADFYSRLQNLASLDNTGRWKKKLDSLNDNTLIESRITADVERTSGTSMKDFKITSNPDGSKEIYLHYFFDEPQVISKIAKELTYVYSNQLPVQFTAIKFLYDEGYLIFKHTTRKAERYFSDDLMMSVFEPTLSEKKISYTIEFPFDVKSSNAMIQSGNTLTWEMNYETAIHNQQVDTAELTKDPALELTYAEKIDRSIGKVSQKENPLIRVQVYNRNKEPVKIGTGVVLKDDAKSGTMLVTNFQLMNLIEGAGYFSIILQSDSLAGIDEMTERDIDSKQDLVFLRFGSPDRYKPLKFSFVANVKYGDKVKIFYYPNTLSSVVYSMDGMISGTKKWTKKTGVVEVKPAKPISLEGGAIFNEAGEFIGMITKAFDGEVGKLYVVPGEYIKSQIPR
ncbi:MAG TPA: serine protease [Ignavibacteria bacterium]|nr:serine protease [Ignavibacteria bacterium]